MTIEAVACGCPVVVGDTVRAESPEEAAINASRLRKYLESRLDWGHIGKRYAEIFTRTKKELESVQRNVESGLTCSRKAMS